MDPRIPLGQFTYCTVCVGLILNCLSQGNLIINSCCPRSRHIGKKYTLVKVDEIWIWQYPEGSKYKLTNNGRKTLAKNIVVNLEKYEFFK